MAGARWTRGLLLVVPLLAALSVVRTTDAAFTGTAVSSGSSFSATTLQPPSNVTATHQCLLGIQSIRLDWTASPSDWTTQYRVSRSVNGGAYGSVATVAYGTNTWTDSPVVAGTTYAYRVRAERTGWSWVSADAGSNSVATPALCL